MQVSAVDACVWGYPLVLFDAAARRNAQSSDAALAGVLPNDDLTDRTVWLDLRSGPAALAIDETSRYYSLTLFDAWGRGFASLGTRTTGNQKQTYAIVPPLWAGIAPHGLRTIEAPTHRVAIVGQTAKVDGEIAGLPFSIDPLGPRAHPGETDAYGPAFELSRESVAQSIAHGGGRAFFERLQRLIRDDAGRYRDYAAWRSVAEDIVANASPELDKALTAALHRIEAGLSMTDPIGGWRAQQRFDARGNAYLERARSCRFHFLAGDEHEVLHRLAFTDDAGEPLHGGRSYRLHFDAWNRPPAQAFWSLTASDARFQRLPTGMPSSSIRSRDALVKNADDSIDILIQSTHPGTSNVNRIAVPKEAFGLILRLYWPRPPALNGLWSPPALHAVGIVARS
jgi:hypothetical protein